MRGTTVLLSFLLLATVTAEAPAQTPSISVHAAGGMSLADPGYNFSAGVEFSPLSRVTLIVSGERAHTPSRITYTHARTGELVGTSAFRGGTATTVMGMVRGSLFPAGHWSPYVLAGYGRGI